MYYLVGLNLGNSSDYNSKHHYLSLASQVWRPLLFDHSQISTSFLPSWVIFFGLVFCGIYNRIFKYLEATARCWNGDEKQMNECFIVCLITEWLNYCCIDPMIWTTHNNHVQRQLTHLLNTDWLTKQLTDGITANLTPWVAEWVSFQPTTRLIYLLTYWLTYRLMDLLTLCLTDWQANLLSNYLTGWLVNLLTD